MMLDPDMASSSRLAADSPAEIEATFDRLAGRFADARAAVERVVIGQRDVVDLALIALLAGGHALIVGLPGLAKTRLVKALGAVMGLDTRRIQFTPDLVPSDILGAEVLETGADGSRAFRFVPGPIFGQLLMADEINRASPRTQSALLEAMQERQVTVAGASRPLPAPFHVLATQNPIEQDGTYPLPEAQLDRFLFQIGVGYPSLDDERDILLATTGPHDAMPSAVLTPADLVAAQALLPRMPVPEGVVEAILRTVRAARPGADHPDILWGPGPRGAQALLLGARARAFLDGRSAPILEDVAALLAPALTHRLALSYGARAGGRGVADLVARLEEQLA
jgi:MoxR-like ATPase